MRIRAFRINLFQGYYNMLDSNNIVHDEKAMHESLNHFQTCIEHLKFIIDCKDINEKEIWPATTAPPVYDNNDNNSNSGNENTKHFTASASINTNITASSMEENILKLAFDTALAAEVMPHAPPHSFKPIKLHKACAVFIKSINSMHFLT